MAGRWRLCSGCRYSSAPMPASPPANHASTVPPPEVGLTTSISPIRLAERWSRADRPGLGWLQPSREDARPSSSSSPERQYLHRSCGRGERLDADLGGAIGNHKIDGRPHRETDWVPPSRVGMAMHVRRYRSGTSDGCRARALLPGTARPSWVLRRRPNHVSGHRRTARKSSPNHAASLSDG